MSVRSSGIVAIKIIKYTAILVVLLLAALLFWYSSAPRAVPFLRFPIANILKERVNAQRVLMQRPLLYINFDAGTVETQFTDVSMTVNDANVAVDAIRFSAPFSRLLEGVYLNGLHIEQTVLTLPNESTPIMIDSIYLDPKQGQENRADISVDLQKMGADSYINGDVALMPSSIDVALDYHNIPSSLMLFIHRELSGVSGTIKGHLSVALDHKLVVKQAALSVDATSSLKITHPVYYPETMTLDHFSIKAEYAQQHHRVDLSSLHIKLYGATINGSGMLVDETLSAELTLDSLSVNDLPSIWPQNVSDVARKWVIGHIKEAVLKDGKARISGDISSVDSFTISGNANIHDARVKYAPHLPEVRQAKGMLSFTQDSLDINVTQGSSLRASKLNHGDITIPSFTDGAIPINIALDIESNAPDVATFLSADHLNKAGGLRLNPATITGGVNGIIKLSFPLYPARGGLKKKSSFDYLDVGLDANITSASQPGILGKWNMRDFSGNVTLDNQQVSVNASGSLQHAPSDLRVTHYYSGARRNETEYDVTLSLKPEQFADFNIPLPTEYVQGTVKLDATVRDNADGSTADATFDFTESVVAVDSLQWVKPRGVDASMMLTENNRGDTRSIDNIVFNTDEYYLRGNILLRKDGALQRAEFPEIDMEFMKGKVAYESVSGQQERINIAASHITLSESKEEAGASTSKRGETQEVASLREEFDWMANRYITLRSDTLITPESRFNNVSFESDCSPLTCKMIQLTADFNEKDTLNVRTDMINGSAQRINVSISDVGGVLNTSDISSRIKGGQLSAKGQVTNMFTAPEIDLMLNSDALSFHEAPLLTKIATLASLSGIMDALQGNGIVFDSLFTEINMTDARILIKKLVAKGDALGLVAAGRIVPNTPSSNIHIEGTVTPSYALNSLPGKIPLIGELLVGGEDEGMFGTRFSVHGTLDEPDVSVNPLSMLTPGFTRNIFGIFSSDPGEERKSNPRTR